MSESRAKDRTSGPEARVIYVYMGFNIGIEFWDPLYCNYSKGPPKPCSS